MHIIPQIRPGEFQQWLDSARQWGEPIVLDVREPGELAIASIQPAGVTVQSIPMGIIPTRLADLNPSQPIACLCHHGARSMQVAMYLARQGFSHVVNMAGGIHAWSAEVDPSVPMY